MKPVDANYSYDELEGFKPLNIDQSRIKRSDIGITVSNKNLRPTAAARKILFARDHIYFFYRPEQKQLLLVSAPGPAENAIPVINPSAVSFHCRYLRDFLEKECRVDLTNHLIYIPGSFSKAKKNAVIFDLSRAESRKRQTRNK